MIREIKLFLVGFLISLYYALKEIIHISDWLLFINSWALGVIVVFSLYDWIHKERADRLKHSMDLYQALLHSMNLKVEIDSFKENLKLYTNEKPNESYTVDYSKEANSHLEDSAYKNIRAIIERREFYINKLYNSESQEFLKELNSKVMSIIPNINLWDEQGSPPTKFYTKHLLKAIQDSVLWYYTNPFDKKRLSNEFAVQYENGLWVLKRSFILIGTDNEAETKEIKHKIIESLAESLESMKFNLLKVYRHDIQTCNNMYTKEIVQIKKDIDSNRPLQGRCEQCPEGDSLWQYIKRYV